MPRVRLEVNPETVLVAMGAVLKYQTHSFAETDVWTDEQGKLWIRYSAVLALRRRFQACEPWSLLHAMEHDVDRRQKPRFKVFYGAQHVLADTWVQGLQKSER